MKMIKKGVVFASVCLLSLVSSYANAVIDEALIKKGESIFTTNTKGNCIACHNANGKTLDGPGTLGPKLQYLAFWPEEALYDKVFDPTKPGDPITAMPAFGRNGWLSDEEIKAVVAYLKTIN